MQPGCQQVRCGLARILSVYLEATEMQHATAVLAPARSAYSE